MQLKFAKLGALFSRFDSALRTPRFALALALALAFAALAPFCGHAAIPLPDGYRRIAYIESSVAGKQYIQLDYIPYRFQIPNEITIKGMYTAADTTCWQSPCGFSTQGGSLLSLNPQSMFGNDANGYLGFVFDGVKMINPSSPVTINWKVGRVSTNPVIGDELVVTYADGSFDHASSINAPLASDYEKPLTLLAVPLAEGGGMSNYANFRLYGATVKQNGELKADLVPVLNPSDVPGLWDNVTGQFLTTQGATQFVHPQPEQWFRFKLLKKNGPGDGGVHVGELALYTADNVNVAEGLQWWYEGDSKLVPLSNAHNTPERKFSFYGGVSSTYMPAELISQAKLFDGKFGTDNSRTPYEYSGAVSDETLNQYTFTLHLDSSKGEVVKYNLMSGMDVSSRPGYALTAWTLERSYDGVNWEYVDEQRDPNTSGFTTKNNTWYRDGGSFSEIGTVQSDNPGKIADHPPTNFYWLFDLPLPKLSRTVYAHTGAPISPEIVEQSQYCTLSGDTVATQVGKYKIVCTPEPGLAWENGSTEPCELEWEIVNDPFPLPADYTRLEWIKSTRQQRLLTDYFPNPKTWMQVDCMFTGLYDGDNGSWSFGLPDCTSEFCDANTSAVRYSIAFTDRRGYFNWLICWVNDSSSGHGAVVLDAGTLPQAGDITKAVDESVCRNLLTISNGVDKSTLEWSTAKADHVERIDKAIPSKTTTCTKRLALFGTAEKNFGTYDMTVWSWKIYESDSGSGVNDPTSHLVHNFIPAKDPDGVPGLWDTVTGEFRASDTDTPFEYQNADQWFRLKITQVAPGKDFLTFSEFALYDAEGVRQNLGLTKATDIDHIGSGQFFHDARGGIIWGDSPSVDLFDGHLGPEESDGKSMMGMTLPGVGVTYDKTTGEITDPQVIIMHLKSDAKEVVKYNLASGDYAADCSPTGWILERSYDGRNWTEIIRKTRATSEYATGSCSWYRDGGGGAAPTTFYPAGNWGEGANQWFRLTIRKKHLGTDAYGLNSLQLDEFALFDAEGKRQDIGLEPNGVSAASLLPGEWYYEGRGDEAGTPTKFWAGQSPSKLFDRNLATKWGVDYALSNLSPLGNGDPAYWQVLTLRLPVWTSEVVSYNLCSGSDTGNYPSRAPTSWVLERSSDGENWVVFDEKTEEDHQYTLESSTWYGNGGKDKDPTNIFWIVKLPLPKLGQTVYSYTGAPISPKMMEESEFYTLSGDTNATNEGTYKLVCTPISGLTWANGSTGPYELVWQIVPETFLQRVASDPKRVDGETVDYDTGYASGGDIVLQIGNEYVHVFTNGTDRTFTAKTELANARILVVGGGGSGGTAYNGYSGAGGGAGGLVEMVTGISASDYRIDVGSGAPAVTGLSQPQGKNGYDSTFGNRTSGSAIAFAKGGGGGGSPAISYVGGGKSSNCDWAIGLSGGSGGGHSALFEGNIGKDSSGIEHPSAGWYSPAPGVNGQGSAGGMAYVNTAGGCSGAGGGGAGGAGAACTTYAVGGVGGIGRVSDILGWSAFFAGGGAGAAGSGAYSSNGGAGGGGSSCSHTMLNDFKDDAERALIMNGSNGQGGGGAGALSKGAGDYGPSSGKGGDGIVIIRYQIPDTTLLATPPVAKTGLTYNGKTQVGVPEGVGYTLTEAYYYATAVGTYTTTATLLPGYEWNDNGNKTAPRDYEWTIEGLRISSVKLVANEAQWTGGDIIPQVASVTTVDGLTFTDASVGWTVSFERERVETTDFKQVGNISVVVTGTGSLSGEARANFRIYDPKKIPLPKPSLAVYKYTGFAITPSFDPSWARDGYNTSGTRSATAKGTYTVTCTLKDSSYTWENGSKAPYDVQWVIGDSFLERLASDTRRVELDSSPYAEGGDLVLHDDDSGVYIHAFTNYNATAAFTAISALSGVEMLLVGGGGGGGYARGSRGGGGGAGGLVHIEGASLAVGSYGITVGKGGSGGWQHDEAKGYTSPSGKDSAIRDLSGLSWLTALGGGGGGGSAYSQFTGNGAAGAAGGCGGGNAGHCPVMTPTVGSQGGNGGVTGNDMAIGGGGGGAGGDGQSYTGSEQALNGGNGVECRILDTSEWFAGGGAGGQSTPHVAPTASGGKGGGGSTCLQQDRDKRDVLWTGEDGLGGGGAGSTGSTDNTELNGGRGGSGIVIIRYADPVNGLVAPVPEGGRVIYNGKTQVGVEELPGSTLSGKYYGDEVGHYTAVATLAPGYTKWADNSTDLSREITWEIYVPSVEASAEDVEQEYDGTSHSITVTVTDPADATVTYSLTEDGEYTGTNPSFTEFGAYRVYWQATKDNYTGAKGSAVVRIGKKAAGEYVRLRITQRTGGPISGHKDPPGEYSVSLAELALYSDAAGTSRFGTGLNLASDLNALKSTRGTCFCTLPDREPNYANSEYCGATVVRLFDEKNYTSILCEGCDFKVEERPSSNAHLMIYMHLSAADAAKVIRSYDLQGASGVEGQSNYSPTAWRLEVSSDCEHWTVIDEKTVADTAGNAALTQNSKWYGKDGSDDKKAYPIEFDYAPLEYLDTNPGEPNYLQVVGFQLEDGNAVTARVQYDGTLSGDKDTLFCQRDLDGKGTFAAGRSSSGLWLDYGTATKSGAAALTDGIVELVAGASGLKLNGASVIAAPGTALTAAPNNSLLLFASDDPTTCDGVPAVNAADLKCYGFQVANSATDPTLRLDLMPASNTVTHAHGLYDRVSGNFYPLQAIAEAGQQPFTSATIASHYAKPMTVKMGDTGWDQLPILTEVDERLASVTNYLTSIPNYWQQEWVPGAVDHAGEYRQIMRGQGPYAGEVTNVYAVGIEVALNANGGTAGATNSVLAVPGRPLPAITGEGALPTMTDSMFAGYWSAQTGGEKYYNADGTSAKDYPATGGPGTLYAHWRQGIKPLPDNKLHFDGKHFILTDYVPQETTWIETEMQAKRDGASSQIKDQSFFGLAEMHEIDSSSYTLYYTMNYAGYSAQIYGWALSTGNEKGKGRGWNLSPSDGAMLNSGKCLVRFGYSGFEVSNQSSGIKKATQDLRMNMLNYFPCTSTLVIGGLGGALPNASSGSQPGYGRPVQPYKSDTDYLDVYSFKIYESANGSPDDAEQTLVRDYIPVTNTIAKVAGLYDVINEVFYPLKTQTIVTLNANGGNQPTNYVYATAGEAMPSPIAVPTRPGYEFAGYTCAGWEVKPMTGNDADFIDEGVSKWAYMAFAGGSRTVNGITFETGLKEISPKEHGIVDHEPSFTTDLELKPFHNDIIADDFVGCTEAYKNVLVPRLENQATAKCSVTFTLKRGLTKDKAYAVQITSYQCNAHTVTASHRLGISEEVNYGTGYPESPKGISFVYRFVATNTAHDVTLYKPQGSMLRISSVQLRELGDASVLDKYYYADGTSDVTYPVSGGPTTLTAMWEPAKYRMINRETGPERAVDYEWLNGVFGEKDQAGYQEALFETNANGVVAWQAYILGVDAVKAAVDGAAIVEETVQNASPETVTIRLRGMPTEPRTNATTRLAYSLLSARTPEGLLNGGGTVVRDLDDNQFERCEQSTFEAPLKDLTDEEPVNYYRIKVHFIFDK